MRLSLIAAALASSVALCEGSTKMVIGYLPNWLYANYPVESVPYNKYTHINYAFAILNNEDNLPSFTDDWAVESSLPKIVNMAHSNNTKVLLSVGGWTGSKRFSPMVSSAESRQKFIDWNLNFIEKYNTDGIDLDWEYPGKQAAGCNEFSDTDADNYLLLLRELRQALDSKFPKDRKEISMAVHVQPFIKSGTPMTDVKQYVPYFDHINLMTYDINGAWATTTGPNAPFEKEEGKGAPFSFVDSIRDWKAAGVPANKITSGLAFYGRTMKAKEDMTVNRNQFQESEVGAPKGDSDDAYWDDPFCNLDAGGLSGIWKWTNLRKEGVLQDVTTAGNGWQRNWDEVSQTPWLFNPSTKHFITYDDPESLKIKVEHALCEDLAGVMVWDIHQDNGELIEAVNRIHGGAPTSCNKPTTMKNNLPDEVIEENPETDIVDDIDNPSSWVPPSATGYAFQISKETHGPNKLEKDEDWLNDASEELSQSKDATELQDSSSTSVNSPLVSTEEPSLSSSTEKSDKLSEQEGQSCSTSGQQKCTNTGKSSQWLTCNLDKWVSRECATGLVCNESQGGVFCDFPKTSTDMKAALYIEKTSNTTSSQVAIPSNSATPSVSAKLHLRASRIITPSHVSNHGPPHATLPVLPNASVEDIYESSVLISKAKASEYVNNNPELDELEADVNDHQLGKGHATLAVEHPGENAQFI